MLGTVSSIQPEAAAGTKESLSKCITCVTNNGFLDTLPIYILSLAHYCDLHRQLYWRFVFDI